MLTSALLWLALPACGEWPRYAHLPTDTAAERLPPGAQVGPTWDVAWSTEVVEETEPADDPRVAVAEALSIGQGRGWESELRGTGWVYEPEAPLADCGDTSAFPYGTGGHYRADVDWRVIDVKGAGYLCSSFAADVLGAQADVVPYAVDACGLPVEPIYSAGEDTGASPVGYGVEGPLVAWALPVSGPMRIAIAAAAWAPDDASFELPYHWGISLLGATEDVTAGCPPSPGTVYPS